MALTKTIPTDSPYSPGNSDVGDVSITGSYTFDVTNIGLEEIRIVLGDSDANLGSLCTSPNVNEYALFRPDGTTPYKAGDFGGYNHEANPPTYFYNKPTSTIITTIDSSNNINLGVIVKKGERPPELNNSNYDWDYIQLDTSTWDGNSEHVTTNTSATGAYDNTVVTIDVGSNDPCTFKALVKAYYTSSTYLMRYDEIEDTYPELTIDARPVYNDAPSTLTLATYEWPEVRHYFYNSSTDTWSYQTPTWPAYSEDQYSAETGIIDDAFEEVWNYTINYAYSVFRNGSGDYYKLSLYSGNFYTAGHTYKLGGDWYEVDSVETGYIFWQVDYSDVSTLSAWPVI